MFTREELIEYIRRQEQRLKNTASAWMKYEVRRGIALARAELVKLDEPEELADGLCPNCGRDCPPAENCPVCWVKK